MNRMANTLEDSMKIARRVAPGLLMLAVPLLLGSGVNESIHVGDGETHEGSFSAVNGKVMVGNNATVRGDLSSVNGGIRIGTSSRVASATSVNGSVTIGAGSQVEGEVSSVNGGITLDDGARAARVGTVNGGIDLTGAEIEGDVRTLNGDVELTQGAIVGGSIVIEEKHSSRDHRSRAQRLTIADGSEVRGDIIVEDPNLDVEVHLRGGGRVLGRIEHARVIKE